MIYLQLFLSYLQIGAFSFGGGYAAMPLIQAQVVEKYHWLSMTEFGDLVTIAEMTPGPIAINSATFVGTQVADFPGHSSQHSDVFCHPASSSLYLQNLYPIPQCKIMQDILGTLRPVVVSMIAVAGLGILSSVFFLSGSSHPLCLTLISEALFSLPVLSSAFAKQSSARFSSWSAAVF